MPTNNTEPSGFNRKSFEEPFEAVPFIDTLCYSKGKLMFDKTDQVGVRTVKNLRDLFLTKIDQLKQLNSCLDIEIKQNNEIFIDDKVGFQDELTQVEETLTNCLRKYQDLRSKVTGISHKISQINMETNEYTVALNRSEEAKNILQLFHTFRNNDFETMASYEDKSKIFENLQIITSVHKVAEDIKDEKFTQAKDNIKNTYDKLVFTVLDIFEQSFAVGDFERMRDCAEALLQSKKFTKCYKKLIDMLMKETDDSGNIFEAIITTLDTGSEIIDKVFPANRKLVINSLIQQALEVVLKNHVNASLDSLTGRNFLERLKYLYKRTNNLEKTIMKKNFGVHISTLELHKTNIFGKYLKSYVENEMSYIRDYYQTKMNQFQDAQSKPNIIDQMNILGINRSAIVQSASQTSNQTSDEIVVTLIQENRMALERCELLCSSDELAKTTSEIFTLLVDFLARIYCSYQLDVALKSLPGMFNKSEPSLMILKTTEQINASFHFIEKHFYEHVLVYVGSSVHGTGCINYFQKIKSTFEKKIEEALEKLLNGYMGWIKSVLCSDKKTDHLAENLRLSKSQTCETLLASLERFQKELVNTMSEANVQLIANEFAMRFLKTLIEYILSFTFTSTGSMNFMCDIKEYLVYFQKFKNPNIDKLFDTLLKLFELTYFKPESFDDLKESAAFVNVDRNLIQSFIQIRKDFRDSSTEK